MVPFFVLTSGLGMRVPVVVDTRVLVGSGCGDQRCDQVVHRRAR